MTDEQKKLLRMARIHLNWVFFGGEFATEMEEGVIMSLASHKEYAEAKEFFNSKEWHAFMKKVSK
ncbi:MAG: hypothetical protein EPN91_08805 [Salinibacterium sp.]|nr:MAG: hypothetical protein EPN91_08805 [Salinibacterium sp.]